MNNKDNAQDRALKRKLAKLNAQNRWVMEEKLEGLLLCVSNEETLATVGATLLIGKLVPEETPGPLDDLADAILLSRSLSLRCLRAFLALGMLEGEKFITA